MKFLDRDHPFFAHPARRLLTTVLPVLWRAVELFTGNPGWAAVFIGAGAYAGWELLIRR